MATVKEPDTKPGWGGQGQIDQLYESFGFIRPFNTGDGRLFFHFKDLSSRQPAAQLCVGDRVEYQIRRDRKDGRRPSAFGVAKVAGNRVDQTRPEQTVSCAMLEGTVVSPCQAGQQGRISHVYNGEYFFLPYSHEAVRHGHALAPGELVFFQIASSTDSMASWAVNVHRPASSRCRGVVSSLKDSFGFIEREDRVQDVFFHFSSWPASQAPAVGAEVEFSVQLSRSGRETAADLVLLPPGSVMLFDIDERRLLGTLLRLPTHPRREPLTGQISYHCQQSGACVQLPFGADDIRSRCSLRPGDRVCFRLATDRRDRLQRASSVELDAEATFSTAREPRQVGIVQVVPTDAQRGCIVADAQRFHFTADELIGDAVEVGCPVRFTEAADCATRVTPLRSLTVTGVVQQPASQEELGIVVFQSQSRKELVCYQPTQLQPGHAPQRLDKVQVDLAECSMTGARFALSVRLLQPPSEQRPDRLRLRASDGEGPRLTLLRHPIRPDEGSVGFTRQRQPWPRVE